ncbi:MULTISPECIES: hypothetical protein [unclassified Streptomyces]|uniref:hypothetical protein n=1 Tax=unclassified Streptomyces TaxID=2593676 RepID=UPI00365FD34C
MNPQQLPMFLMAMSIGLLAAAVLGIVVFGIARALRTPVTGSIGWAGGAFAFTLTTFIALLTLVLPK